MKNNHCSKPAGARKRRADSIDVNIMDEDKLTALSLAAVLGRLQCMELLVVRGADIDHRNNDNRTALHQSAKYGYEACVSLLLTKDAAIDDHDIDSYQPYSICTDCRPLIVAEIEHRRKRTAFDTFNHHHIEYRP